MKFSFGTYFYFIESIYEESSYGPYSVESPYVLVADVTCMIIYLNVIIYIFIYLFIIQLGNRLCHLIEIN